MAIGRAWMAAVITVGLIAGCRAGADAERQAIIDQEMKECVAGFSPKGGALAGVDGQLICACFVDRVTGTKDVAQLREMTQQTKPSDADVKTMGDCVVEEARRKGVIAK